MNFINLIKYYKNDYLEIKASEKYILALLKNKVNQNEKK